MTEYDNQDTGNEPGDGAGNGIGDNTPPADEAAEPLDDRFRSGGTPRLLDVCGDRLRSDPLITDVLATRLIRPEITINVIGTSGTQNAVPPQRAVVPRTLLNPAAAVRRIAGIPGATWLAAQGGVSPIPQWNHPDLLAPAAQQVAVTDLAEMIATRTLRGPGAETPIRFDAADVAALTEGRPALLATPAPRALEPTGAAFDSPGAPDISPTVSYAWVMPPPPSQVTISDLAGFLAEPRTPGGLPLSLTPEQVSQLLDDGRAEVAVTGPGGGEQTVTVVVDAADDAANLQASQLSTYGSNPPTIQLAIALRWRQRWELDGYTRGALLSTIALAPQEQTTIEIFTWDRRRTETETRSSAEVNNNTDTTDTLRDTADVLSETKRTSNLDWSARGGLSVPILTYARLNLDGSVQDRETVDRLCRETTSHFHEAVTKSATSVRLSRETKVNETTEIGSERRVTRTVSNQNLCHVLNLDYFEVLSKYTVTTAFDRSATRLVALVPSPLAPSFTRLTVRAHESVLRDNLLEPDLTDAFDAVRLLASKAHACEVACERCTCDGGATPTLQLPEYTAASMRTIGQVWNTMQTTVPPPAAGGFTVDGLARARRWMYRFAVEILAPEVANCAWTLLTATIGINQRPLTREDADRLWWAVTNLGGVDAIRPSKLASERSQQLDDIAWDYFVAVSGGFFPRDHFFTSTLRSIVDDIGMTAALDRFMASFSATSAATSSTATSSPAADPGQAARDSAIREAFPLRTVTDALEREQALLEHLSMNTSHYWYALWQATPSIQQAALLEDSLPRAVLEPQTIGMIGNYLAFPVSGTVAGVDEVLAGLFADQDPPPPRVEQMTLPTPAVTMEARLGTCQACEPFIRETRRLDLRTRSATADQAQAEADRRQARLDGTPPTLTSFAPPARPPRLDVHLEQIPPAAPTP